MQGYHRKLHNMEPGLIKITYSFRDHPKEELALILSHYLARAVSLPNNALDYTSFLREGMKHAYPSNGLKPIGPFYGQEIRDEHVENAEGRTVRLNPSFCDYSKNFNPLLIPCNSPFFWDAIDEMKRSLFEAGFDVDSSNWDNYKLWEAEKLKTF